MRDHTSEKESESALEGELELVLPHSTTNGKWTVPQKEKTLEGWYREQLYHQAEVYVKHYQEQLNVQVQELRIKKMKTRWGTCNPKAKRVWLNLELIKRSPKCLEYVVLHELCHLIEASHNQRFKGLLTQHMPPWRQYERELDKLPIGCIPAL